ncbi:MAG: methylthioribulose 1-phosphate dehydratase [Planctomycetales bacterium]|nr:methylthioribulose 1-phosphate dehydratase [Planctomycetales bacterium]
MCPSSLADSSPVPLRADRDVPVPSALAGLEEAIDHLRAVGRNLWQRGWSLGTSSNYSVVLNQQPLELLVTASGKDKGNLQRADFVRVGEDGTPTLANQPKSSAETLLHVVLAELPQVGAILHTHSVWATLLSDLYFPTGRVTIAGYEMLKGLEGIKTHDTSICIPIFDNTQDIPELAQQVRQYLQQQTTPQHAFLIRNHGLYTWGPDLAVAHRHIEILEFLFETTARRLTLPNA